MMADHKLLNMLSWEKVRELNPKLNAATAQITGE
jgi:hypothetical protein